MLFIEALGAPSLPEVNVQNAIFAFVNGSNLRLLVPEDLVFSQQEVFGQIFVKLELATV